MFSKRHMEAIATAMQLAAPEAHWDANKHAQWDVTVNRLADVIAMTSERFDRARFIHACQPGSNVRARTAHITRAGKLAAMLETI